MVKYCAAGYIVSDGTFCVLVVIGYDNLVMVWYGVLSTRLPQPLSYHAVTTTEQDFGTQKEYSEMPRRVIIMVSMAGLVIRASITVEPLA